VDHYNFYSMILDPMTTCGCCECIAALLPQCNGIMTVGRDYTGETPCGMKFTTLAGVMGGGASSPGFVGHSKFNITQRKFILGDGGIKRLVWMPKVLKDEIRERLIKRGEEVGMPDLVDRIADETVGVTEEEILAFLQEKKHPALEMDPLIGGEKNTTEGDKDGINRYSDFQITAQNQLQGVRCSNLPGICHEPGLRQGGTGQLPVCL
jgi:acetyl-CoA synthase